MSRAIKSMLEKDMRSRYAALSSLLVVNVHGLSGNDVNSFRRELGKKDIEVHVIKNSAAKRAFADTVLEPLAAQLAGPCAFVTGGDSPIDAAKELLRLAKEFPALELREGLIDGEPELFAIEVISQRKTKVELQGEVLMLATSPGRRIAGQLLAGGRIAGCIKAVIKKLEDGEKIAKAA